jgi:hypothetical protein
MAASVSIVRACGRRARGRASAGNRAIHGIIIVVKQFQTSK